MLRKISLIFLFAAALFVSAYLIFFYKSNIRIEASAENNVYGFAWTEDFGWLSFNSLNCDSDNDGKSEGAPGCPPAEVTVADYGVNLNCSTGNFSGYAWSQFLGWIKFDPNGPFPSGDAHGAKLEANKVTGWARAEIGEAPSASWDGWIRMSNVANYSMGIPTLYLAGNDSVCVDTPPPNPDNVCEPQSIDMGDINGDGKNDLIVGNRNPNMFSILFNDGDGTFNDFVKDYPLVHQYPDYNWIYVKAAQVNPGLNPGQDSYLDVVVVNRGDTDRMLLVFKGNGDGSFLAPIQNSLPYRPSDLAIGKLNTDQAVDYAVVSALDDKLMIMYNLGDGSYDYISIQSYNTNSEPRSLAIGDLDNDGDGDIVVGNSGATAHNVSVFTNNGSTFAKTGDYPTPWGGGSGSPADVALSDVNGDGYNDLIASSQSRIAVFINNKSGGFLPRNVPDIFIPDGEGKIAIGNMDADNMPDIFLSTTNELNVLFNDGDGTFDGRPIEVYDGGGNNVQIMDLNSDNIGDIATTKSADDRVRVYLKSSNPDYGVIKSGNYLNGYAWGSNNVGWISFSSKNCDPDGNGLSNGSGGCPAVGSPISSYGVSVICGPRLVLNDSTEGPYCLYAPSYYRFLNWTYYDSDGVNEKEYKLQVDDNDDFGSLVVDITESELDNPSGTNHTQSLLVSSNEIGPLKYNKTYNWRVAATNANDVSTGWLIGQPFTTIPVPYPDVDFDWNPDRPAKDELVEFTGNSDSEIIKWIWDFPDGIPVKYNKNETVSFPTIGTKAVTLTVEDTNSNSCSKTGNVPVGIINPFWKEIIPW